MLEVRRVHKRDGQAVAVDGVSVSVPAGACVGFLGPNGAGKTTTVSMIAGVLRPDAGEVLLDGQAFRGDTDPRKSKLGLVPQELALYEELSADENLRFFGALYDLTPTALRKAMDEALAFVGLAERRKDRVKDFSGGMKRRLNLAAALLHDPDLLILDEPTVGVDPQSRAAMFANLEALKARGKAILYTTHYMEEAERLADRLVIMDRGHVVADDTLRALVRAHPIAQRLVVEVPGAGPEAAWLAPLGQRDGVASANLNDGVLTLELADLADAPAILAWLQGQGLALGHFASEKPNLEAIFLVLTGRALRDAPSS
jgi:ABC-2 type transport system ATP-binding protein